jgi:hypothetical protein
MYSIPFFRSFPHIAKLVNLAAALAALAQAALQAATVVQIPVGSVLNTRSVTTLTDGRLVTWQVGIDGGGNGSGYLTMAASLFKGDKNPKALPDSGRFPADARHPEIVLNYSNADGTGNQTRYVRGAGDFTFPVPQARYSKLFLFFTSAEGASSLQIRLDYSDSSQTLDVEMPDYYNDLKAGDPMLFYLAKDLAKWSKANVMTEADHHNIDGVEINPSPGRTLVSVKVSKTAKGYLVFWGATGMTESNPVPLRPASESVRDMPGPVRTVRLKGSGVLFAGPQGGPAFTASGRESGPDVPVPPAR